MSKIKTYLIAVFGTLLLFSNVAIAGGDHSGPAPCGVEHSKVFFDATNTAFHHIADANVYSIGGLQLPLPCILYAPSEGLSMFSSGKFHPDGHGMGSHAHNGYVLDEGSVKRVAVPGFPSGSFKLEGGVVHKKDEKDAEKSISYACHQGKLYKLDGKSTADFGLFGGGITSFYDFSITKNVTTMLIVFAFLAWLFIGMARKYKNNRGQAPTGVQALLEPVFLFIQEEVSKPFLGDKWEKFQPFLMSLFFFILGLNLFGQIPFLGGSNVTGNLGFTAVLAVIAFLVTNLNGNKHYWEHTLWMPGVPTIIKILVLTPVEILGLFIKPITLALRLFANITAGHMVILIFVGLIFMFGQNQWGASLGTSVASTLLTLFMMTIELIVAFIQAFVFTILTASYIGAAIDDHGHHEEAHH